MVLTTAASRAAVDMTNLKAAMFQIFHAELTSLGVVIHTDLQDCLPGHLYPCVFLRETLGGIDTLINNRVVWLQQMFAEQRTLFPHHEFHCYLYTEDKPELEYVYTEFRSWHCEV